MVWKDEQVSASFFNQMLLICMKMSLEAASERNKHTLICFLKADLLDENMNKAPYWEYTFQSLVVNIQYICISVQ